MPNASRLLNDGEELVVDVRPHWWYLAGPVAVLVVVLAGAFTALIQSAPAWADWASVAGLVLAAAWLLGRYVRWATTSLMVTTSRLIHRSGVLSRRGREIPLAALTDISYRQSLFERIIGAGDLLLESAGRDGQEVFPDLPRPARIQNEIARQVDRARGQAYFQNSAPAVASAPPVWAVTDEAGATLSIPLQIEQLDDLRRRGIISNAEFKSKKAELLDRL